MERITNTVRMGRGPRRALAGLLILLVISTVVRSPTLSAAPPPPLLQDDTAQLDPSKLSLFPGPSAARDQAGAGLDSPSLLYPDFTYRHDWGLRNGWWNLTLTDSRIRKTSNVFVSASEVSDIVSTVDPIPTPFVGSARYLVYNVAPRNGAVTVRIYIDWSTPVSTQLSYMVLNP
jgi:hypothetical protein